MINTSCLAAAPFDLLVPLPSGERFAFCLGEGWPDAADLPAIDAYCREWGVTLLRWLEGGQQCWCFVVGLDAALCEDFAGGFVIELSNAGYLQPCEGAEERYVFV